MDKQNSKHAWYYEMLRLQAEKRRLEEKEFEDRELDVPEYLKKQM